MHTWYELRIGSFILLYCTDRQEAINLAKETLKEHFDKIVDDLKLGLSPYEDSAMEVNLYDYNILSLRRISLTEEYIKKLEAEIKNSLE